MKSRSREKGGSAAEFALILPFLLLILFAIIEYGFILYDKSVITNASREGARTGIVYRVDETETVVAVPLAEIENKVSAYTSSRLISFGTAPSIVKTEVGGNCLDAPHALTVTVTYPYTFLVVPNFSKGLPGQLTLEGQTVMNCENQ